MSIEIKTPKMGISGHVELTVMRGNEVRFHSKFKNLVLNQFFDAPIFSNTAAFFSIVGVPPASGGNLYNQIALGTEITTPPDPEDVGLNNQVAIERHGNSTSINTIIEGSFVHVGNNPFDDYRWARCSCEFEEGSVVGNLTEVGLASNSGTAIIDSTKRSRVDFKSLIKDSSGNPVSIPITAMDRIIVSYELRIKRPPAIISEPFTLGGYSLRLVSTSRWINSGIEGVSYEDWFYDRTVGSSVVEIFARETANVGTVSSGLPFGWTGTLGTSGGFPTINFSTLMDLTAYRANTTFELPAIAEDRFLTRFLVPHGSVTNTNSGFYNPWSFREPLPIELFAGSTLVNTMNACKCIGMLVHADTGIPIANNLITIPAGHRLEVTLNPHLDDSVRWPDMLERA